MDCAEARESLAAGEASRSLEGHLAVCAHCRLRQRSYAGVLESLRSRAGRVPTLESVRPPARWIPLAAAAGLLTLASGGLRFALSWKSPATPPATLPAPVRPAFPRLAGAPGRVVLERLGPGAHVETSPGAEAELLSEDRVALHRGRLFARSGPGPLRVGAPLGEFRASGAVFEVVVRDETRSAGLSLFREALAGGAAVEVAVLEGIVCAQAPGWSGEVRSGQVLLLESGAEPVLRTLPAGDWTSRLSWRDGPLPAQNLLPEGRIRLESPGPSPQWLRRSPPLPGRFLWRLRLRGLSRGAYLQVLLPERVGEVEDLTLAGLPQLCADGEHVVELRWDLSPCLTVDGEPLKSFAAGSRPEGPCPLGLGVTGGSVEILKWEWKGLP